MINFVNCSANISSTVSVSKSKESSSSKDWTATQRYIFLAIVSALCIIGISLKKLNMQYVILLLIECVFLALCVASLILIAIGRVDNDLKGPSRKYHSTLWFMLVALSIVPFLLCTRDIVMSEKKEYEYIKDDQYLSIIILSLFVFVLALILNIILGLVLNGASKVPNNDIPVELQNTVNPQVITYTSN